MASTDFRITGLFRRRKLIAKLLLMTASILVAVLAVEAALRWYGFTYFNAYTVDPDLGFSLRRNAEGRWGREGSAYIKINSQGFRDREHTLAKPAGTFRIAILGDSFAEALQVSQENTFWSVLEQRVQACRSDVKIEVLNFGVSGFSTARELIMLQKHVWQYSPDLVVLLFTPGNDVRDNSRALNQYKVQPLPYYYISEGRLELDNSLLDARNQTWSFRLRQSGAGRAFNWLQDHSRVLGLFYAVREAWDTSEQARKRRDYEPGIDDEVYRAPARAEWAEAWQVTERLLVRMRDEVQARGAKFILATGSSSIQANPNANVRQEFMSRLEITSLSYPNERIQSLGRGEDFPVVDIAPMLLAYATRTGAYVHGAAATGGKGHWNEVGHRLVGETMSDYICRMQF